MNIIQNQSYLFIINIIRLSIIKPKYTPAITIVELCNNADIGVGADIAFNNQEENGNCADLEKNKNIKEIASHPYTEGFDKQENVYI